MRRSPLALFGAVLCLIGAGCGGAETGNLLYDEGARPASLGPVPANCPIYWSVRIRPNPKVGEKTLAPGLGEGVVVTVEQVRPANTPVQGLRLFRAAPAFPETGLLLDMRGQTRTTWPQATLASLPARIDSREVWGDLLAVVKVRTPPAGQLRIGQLEVTYRVRDQRYRQLLSAQPAVPVAALPCSPAERAAARQRQGQRRERRLNRLPSPAQAHQLLASLVPRLLVDGISLSDGRSPSAAAIERTLTSYYLRFAQAQSPEDIPRRYPQAATTIWLVGPPRPGVIRLAMRTTGGQLIMAQASAPCRVLFTWSSARSRTVANCWSQLRKLKGQ